MGEFDVESTTVLSDNGILYSWQTHSLSARCEMATPINQGARPWFRDFVARPIVQYEASRGPIFQNIQAFLLKKF